MTYEISTDKSRLDIALIHHFLSTEAYWSPGVSREKVERAIANSLVFGAYDGERQVGLARVVTDYVSLAYLADVFVVREHRGRGVSKLLVAAIRAHPELQGVRRWLLVTRDAHELYRQYGFAELENPSRYMEGRPASLPSPPSTS